MIILETTFLTAEQKKDIEAFLTIVQQNDHSFKKPYLSNQFNTFSDMPCFFLSYEENQLLGLATIYADGTTEDPVEISLYVLPEKRQQGLATAIFRRVDTTLKKFGYPHREYVTENFFWEKHPAFFKNHHLSPIRSEYQLRAQAPLFTKSTLHAKPRVSLRKMQQKDSDVVIRLQSEAFATPKSESTKYVTESYQDPAILAFVLEHENQVIGYCAVDTSADYYLFGLAVFSDYQKQGYGSFLVQAMMAELHAQQPKHFVLGVTADNLGALRVYQQAGFKIETEIIYLRKNEL